MNSKILNKIQEYQSPAVLLVLFLKFSVYGFKYSDCLGALVLLSYISVDKVIVYLFPKRPDLYTVTDDLRNELNQLALKNEELASNVNAIKFSKGLSR